MKRSLVLFLLVSLLGITFAQSQSIFKSTARQSARFALEQVGDSEVSGSVLLSDYGRGQTVIVAELSGLRPTGLYPIRLRQGTCGDHQGLDRFLGTLPGQSGLMTYVLNMPYEQLRGMDLHLAVSEPTSGVLACGEVGPAVTPLAERTAADAVTEAPATDTAPAATPEAAEPAEDAVAEDEEPTDVTEPAETEMTDTDVTDTDVTEAEPVEVEEPAEEVEAADEAAEEGAAEADAEARIIEVRVASREDDAQEFLNESNAGHPPGFMHLNSRYIALSNNPEGWGTDQVAGIRFVDVDIPQGAIIERAYLQFTVFEANDGPVALTIRAEASDDAPQFQDGDAARFNLSQRQTTGAAQTWEPPAWDEVGAAGEAQRTPDLASVIQEVVDRPGWEAGNALVFVFTDEGDAQGRMAVAYRENRDRAPLLVVEFRQAD